MLLGALKNSSEYKSAGVPMLPVVHGNQKTKEQILIYSVILFGICLLSCFTLNLGFFYIISFSKGQVVPLTNKEYSIILSPADSFLALLFAQQLQKLIVCLLLFLFFL